MLVTFLVFFIQLGFLVYLAILFISHGISTTPFSIYEVRNGLISLIGLIWTIFQIGNPLEFYKKITGGYTTFPWFRRVLKRQLGERLKYRKASLIGEGRKFILDLYIERKDAELEFSKFLKSGKSIFAVFGESGVGKTNFLLGVSQKWTGSFPQIFYQGVQLQQGIKSELTEDLPWAFRNNESLLEAGKLISVSVSINHNPLFVFVDGLDDIPAEARPAFIEDVYMLTEMGIRFVFACKEVPWRTFLYVNGSKSLISQCVFEPEGGDIPGLRLKRCTDEELQAAWKKYSAYFDLKGDLADEIKQEASLFYMLRLIGETFQGKSVPNDLNSAKLFESFWVKKTEQINDPLSCLIITRAIAKKMLDEKRPEVAELQVWPEGLSSQLSRAYRNLETEDVLSIRSENQNRQISFFHEKFQSYAICILLGEWHKRAVSNESKQLANELISMADNPLVSNAFEFFVLAYDQGISPLSANILESDLLAATQLFSQVHEPYSLAPDQITITNKIR